MSYENIFNPAELRYNARYEPTYPEAPKMAIRLSLASLVEVSDSLKIIGVGFVLSCVCCFMSPKVEGERVDVCVSRLDSAKKHVLYIYRS